MRPWRILPTFTLESLPCCPVIACFSDCLSSQLEDSLWESRAMRVLFAIDLPGQQKLLHLANAQKILVDCIKYFQQLSDPLLFFPLHSTTSDPGQPFIISHVDYGKTSTHLATSKSSSSHIITCTNDRLLCLYSFCSFLEMGL